MDVLEFLLEYTYGSGHNRKMLVNLIQMFIPEATKWSTFINVLSWKMFAPCKMADIVKVLEWNTSLKKDFSKSIAFLKVDFDHILEKIQCKITNEENSSFCHQIVTDINLEFNHCLII